MAASKRAVPGGETLPTSDCPSKIPSGFDGVATAAGMPSKAGGKTTAINKPATVDRIIPPKIASLYVRATIAGFGRHLKGAGMRRPPGSIRLTAINASISTIKAIELLNLTTEENSVAQLIVRDLSEDLVKALKQRAAKRNHSAEQEHREILQSVLRGPKRRHFADVLAAIHNVGEASDFQGEQSDKRG